MCSPWLLSLSQHLVAQVAQGFGRLTHKGEDEGRGDSGQLHLGGRSQFVLIDLKSNEIGQCPSKLRRTNVVFFSFRITSEASIWHLRIPCARDGWVMDTIQVAVLWSTIYGRLTCRVVI